MIRVTIWVQQKSAYFPGEKKTYNFALEIHSDHGGRKTQGHRRNAPAVFSNLSGPYVKHVRHVFKPEAK